MCSTPTASSLRKLSAADWIRPEILIHVQWISFPGRRRCRNKEIFWAWVCPKLQTYMWAYTMTSIKEWYMPSSGWMWCYFNQEPNNSVACIIMPATIRLEERPFHFNIHNSPAAGCFLNSRSSSFPHWHGSHSSPVIYESIPGMMSNAWGHMSTHRAGNSCHRQQSSSLYRLWNG